MRLNRFVVAPVIVLVVAGLVVGVLTGDFTSAARRGLYATGLLSHAGASTLSPSTFASPATPRTPTRQPEPDPRGAPPAVLVPATVGGAPTASRVAAKVNAVKRPSDLGRFSGSVIDGWTGRVLFKKNATRAFLPASTMKLLTTTAALSILGPEHQFATRVVTSGSRGIILVGGGDPYLTKAASTIEPDQGSLAQLAALTAEALKKNKRTSVQLGYDTSLFSGPGWHPDWPGEYRDQVTPVSSLWVNEGRVGGSVGARVHSPAKAAAEDFADALAARGIRVTKVRSQVAAPQAGQLAAVKSLTLQRIVEHLLMVSDNDAAEVVSRQAAIGVGRPGSFAAGRAAVRARLTKLGVWDDSARIRDGSGLSRSNRVPSDLMVKVLRLDLEPAHPELRAVITGLAVAAVEGSLRIRYSEKGTGSARGLIHGKTGTLTGVHALAGYVRSPDGSLLVFAFLVNDAKDYFATRSWLDRVTATLSTCGCR